MESLAALAFRGRYSWASQETEAPPVLRPYFPSLAHQFVWRNWDLVQRESIARALDSTREEVTKLGRTMGLCQQNIPNRHWHRLRFKVLRRNWNFVPYSQLTVMLNMSVQEIQAMLSQDAFYIGDLGPKPECPRVRIEEPLKMNSAVIPHFRASMTSSFEEERFHFMELLDRPIPESPEASRAGKIALKPRIAFPYYAKFGNVLGNGDFKFSYPATVLENMARMGLSAIWLGATYQALIRTNIFPEFGKQSPAQLANLNWLIAEAKKHGLGVYLYLNEPRGMPASFFKKYPGIKGAPGRPGDGLFSMCTSTKTVQDYLVGATARLFREAQGLEGIILITASENPTNCYSLTRYPKCPCCLRQTGPEVVAQVIRLMDEGARSVAPGARVIAWDWSWEIVEDDPQTQIIDSLPTSATLMVDFERGTVIEREGIKSTVEEYSLSVVGPSSRAAAHIRLGKTRGMDVMAKIQVGTTWEVGLVPYIPVEQLLVRKFEAMRAAGITGAMESWTLGGFPSENWGVAASFYRRHASDGNDDLEEMAASLYGATAANRVVRAWGLFSDAFGQYPFSDSVVYSSVVQCGPAALLYFEPTGLTPRIMNSYDNLGWTQPFGPRIVANMFRKMASGWELGLKELEGAMQAVPAAQRGHAATDLRVCRAIGLYFRSVANQVRFHASRERWKASVAGLDSMKMLVNDEISVARQFLEICSEDSRLGFEASLGYLYLPMDIREKLVACQYMIEKQIPEAEARLKASRAAAARRLRDREDQNGSTEVS